MHNIQVRCKHDPTMFRTIDAEPFLGRALVIAKDWERVGEFVRVIDVRNDNNVVYQTAIS